MNRSDAVSTIVSVAQVDRSKLDARVERAADAALRQRNFVTAIDVLIGVGWLHQRHVDVWRQGRVETLEELVAVEPAKASAAIQALRRWALDRGLEPTEAPYLARSRARKALRFSESGDPDTELVYRTHWVSPELSERQRDRLVERQSRPPDLVVISPIKDWTCSVCALTSGALLIMEDGGPVCLQCAEMDHLVFLASGDAALTRRAKAGSGLAAVVVRFSRARRRYERQGTLVEEPALERAEAECLADEQARARRRERETARRAEEDAELQKRMAAEIAQLFPGCPTERAAAIAQHAAKRGSGRVGRTAAGRALDRGAIELAIAASVRHEDTDYDELLMSGLDRADARDRVRDAVSDVLDRWRSP